MSSKICTIIFSFDNAVDDWLHDEDGVDMQRSDGMYGWTGTILKVDLSTGSVTYEPLSEDLRHNFVGGRGINSKILYDATDSNTSPFAPDNLLIFGTSPLSGTAAPSTPRCTVSAKSPLTGILGDANFGGFFGPALKACGFDHVVVTGKAEAPVLISIGNGKAEIQPAEHLWGRSTHQTETMIRQRANGKKVHIAAIGPAGEKLVHTACIVHGHNVAGRTGMGAVMGAKNLKAVVVSDGTGKPSIADPERFSRVSSRLRKKIQTSPFYPMFATYGMAGPLAIENESGILSVRNFQQAGGFETVEQVTCETIARDFYTGSKSCFSCSVGCMKEWEVKSGPYAGLKGTKIPEGCNAPNGPNCGNAYAPSLFKIYDLCNGYGIDVLDFGCLMASVMEWYEKGIITREDTGGLSFEWGNYESMIAMIPRIALREGFGAVLADGAVRAAQRIGRDAERYVSSCKGMIIGGQDIRGLKGTALCFATATRGCDHLRGSNMLEIPIKGKSLITPEEAVRRFGSAQIMEHDSYVKANPVIYFQDIYTLADSLQICKFMTSHNGHGINIQDMADLFSAVTGIEADEERMRICASRIYAVERCYAVRQGITRDDDFLQGKWVMEPTHGGPFDGSRLEREKFGEMLEDYYAMRGWDVNTGIPTRETLEKLNLQDVADDLQRLGKL
jgi:aldehyde:ferredoxin oxidoreductase